LAYLAAYKLARNVAMLSIHGMSENKHTCKEKNKVNWVDVFWNFPLCRPIVKNKKATRYIVTEIFW